MTHTTRSRRVRNLAVALVVLGAALASLPMAEAARCGTQIGPLEFWCEGKTCEGGLVIVDEHGVAVGCRASGSEVPA